MTSHDPELDFDLASLWKKLQGKLKDNGIDVDFAGDGKRVKVVCVTPNLKDSVDEMGQALRDQVVMVRVDEQTSQDLDAWVETGAVKSRSEAAALFIKEGLKVRASELEALREALDEVETAKERLRGRAKEVFGSEA